MVPAGCYPWDGSHLGFLGNTAKQDCVCVCACVSMHRYFGRELRKFLADKPASIPNVLNSLFFPD